MPGFSGPEKATEHVTQNSGGTERVFHIAYAEGSGSGRFTIDASSAHAWSHIAVQNTRTDGTRLSLHAARASRPLAVAQEEKTAERPGVAESARAIAGVFVVVDHDGEELATIRKAALRSVWRTTWEIQLTDGSRVTGREANAAKAALRRLLMLAELLIDIPIRLRSGFVFRGADGILFTIDADAESRERMTVRVRHPADERIAILQAALTRTR